MQTKELFKQLMARHDNLEQQLAQKPDIEKLLEHSLLLDSLLSDFQETVHKNIKPLLPPYAFNVLLSSLAVIKKQSAELILLLTPIDVVQPRGDFDDATGTDKQGNKDIQHNDFYIKQWKMWFKILYFLKTNRDTPLSVAEITDKIIKQEGIEPDSPTARRYGLNINTNMTVKFQAGIIGRNKINHEYKYFLIKDDDESE